MKTALIRIFAVATLAALSSTFAAADESRPEAVAKTSTQHQQDGCPGDAKSGEKMKTGDKTQNNEQNGKNYDRVLLGIYG